MPYCDPNVVIPAIRAIKRGEKVIYHHGFLAKEQTPSTALMSEELLARARAGKIALLQRRLGPSLRQPPGYT